LIGQTVSHYRIIDKLGEGGMGEVFLAEKAEKGSIPSLITIRNPFPASLSLSAQTGQRP
jgi:hypothetical protein